MGKIIFEDKSFFRGENTENRDWDLSHLNQHVPHRVLFALKSFNECINSRFQVGHTLQIWKKADDPRIVEGSWISSSVYISKL